MAFHFLKVQLSLSSTEMLLHPFITHCNGNLIGDSHFLEWKYCVCVWGGGFLGGFFFEFSENELHLIFYTVSLIMKMLTPRHQPVDVVERARTAFIMVAEQVVTSRSVNSYLIRCLKFHFTFFLLITPSWELPEYDAHFSAPEFTTVKAGKLLKWRVLENEQLGKQLPGRDCCG